MSKIITSADTYRLLEEVIKRLERLDRIEARLEDISRKHITASIEEISLSRACKLLRLGEETILRHVETGELKARKYKDSQNRLRYRFKLADVVEFQTNGTRASERLIERRQANQRVNITNSIRQIINEHKAAY